MKNLIITLVALTSILTSTINAQASFTTTSSLCSGNSVTVSANSGTQSAIAYSWAASPSGPAFSSASSANTTINFPFAGTYTIALGILSGSGYSYATNTIVINPTPTLTISASSSTSNGCPAQSVTLTASGAASYSWISTGTLNTTVGAVVIVSPTVSTSYNVTGTLGSCSASVAQILIVTPLPGNGSITVSPIYYSVCAGFTSTVTAFGATSYTWTGTSITSPVIQQSLVATPGTYTVSGYSSGCLLTNTCTIGLMPPITIGVTQSSQTTCVTSNLPKFSKPVHLTASGAGIYAWFPYIGQPNTGPTFDVRPATTTCYTVVGTTPNCSNTAVVCVTVIPQFTIGVAPSSVTMCAGETWSLAVVNVGFPATGPASAYTYSWTEALNAPPISISSYFTPTVNVFPQNSTSYTIETRDANMCVSFPEVVAVNVNACAGMQKIAYDNSFMFYPNPVNSLLYFRSGISANITLRILDILGKGVITEQLSTDNEKEFSIDFYQLKPGIYSATLFNEDGHALLIRRIVKE